MHLPPNVIRRPTFLLAAVLGGAVLLAGCSAEARKGKALERGSAALKAGDLPRAQIEYQTVLQKFPDDPAALKGLAQVWRERGSTVRPLAYLSRLLTKNPTDIESRIARAEILQRLGKLIDVRSEAVAILQQSPGSGAALVLLCDAVRDRQDLTAAEAALGKFPDKNSNDYQIASAQLLRVRGDRAKARAILQRLVSADSKSAAAGVALANLLSELNEPAEAATQFKAAVERSPIRSMTRLQYVGFLLKTGAVAEGRALLNDLLRQAPDFLPAWRGLAQVAVAEKRFADADQALQKALAIDGADYEAQVQRAQLLLAQGDAKRAIEELQRLGRDFAGLGLELQPLAMAHLQVNDANAAIAALQKATAFFPDNVDAALLLAQLHLRTGGAEAAMTVLAKLIGLRPDLVQAYPLLAEAAQQVGKLDDVGRALADSLEKSPDAVPFLYGLGLVRIRQDRSADARPLLEKSRRLAPDFLPAALELMALEIRLGRPEVAEKSADELIAKAPKSAVGHVFRAQALVAQKRWNDAVAAATAAVDLEPGNVSAYTLLSQSLSGIEDRTARFEKLDAFLAARPGDLGAALMAGPLYLQAREYGKLRDVYEKHLVAKPNEAVVMNNLANLYADQFSQLDRALELARKAAELTPGTVAISDTLGWLLYRKGQFAEALPLAEAAVRGQPQNPEVQYHLGVILKKLGRTEDARAALRAAVDSTVAFDAKADAQRELEELAAAAPAPKR